MKFVLFYHSTAIFHSLHSAAPVCIRTWKNCRPCTRNRSGNRLVIVGSYVPSGADVGAWVCSQTRGIAAFYDIDTAVTIEQLQAGSCDYLTASQIADYDLYLSFTGGPVLKYLEQHYGARLARPLYCSFDPDSYHHVATDHTHYDLGYLGTYSEDRQPALKRMLLQSARQWPDGRFMVAGSRYPASIKWPANVHRIEHAPPQPTAGFTMRSDSL